MLNEYFNFDMGKKPKLLVLATTFPRWRGDTEPWFIYELSRRMTKKYDVIVLVPHCKNSKCLENIAGLKVKRFRYFYPDSLEKLCYGGGIIQNIKSNPALRMIIPFMVAAEFFAALRIVIKEKIDIVHAHWIVPQGFVAAIIKKITGVRYIATAHAGDVFPLKSGFMKSAARFVLRNSSYCTANSAYTKKNLINIGGTDRIKIIPMGVDLKRFSSSKSSSSLKKKIDAKQIILSVGRLAEKKGIIYLITAMPMILKKFPKAKLVIAGDGSERQSLERKVKEMGVDNNVIFAGNVKNSELPEYYSSSDVFVGPSIITKKGDTEGLGVVFLESIAAGTPVIGSNVGGIPDIIIHGKTGLLVEQKSPQEIADSVIKILSNKNLAKNLIKNAKKHISKKYSWDTIEKEFSELIAVSPK